MSESHTSIVTTMYRGEGGDSERKGEIGYIYDRKSVCMCVCVWEERTCDGEKREGVKESRNRWNGICLTHLITANKSYMVPPSCSLAPTKGCISNPCSGKDTNYNRETGRDREKEKKV